MFYKNGCDKKMKNKIMKKTLAIAMMSLMTLTCVTSLSAQGIKTEGEIGVTETGNVGRPFEL